MGRVVVHRRRFEESESANQQGVFRPSFRGLGLLHQSMTSRKSGEALGKARNLISISGFVLYNIIVVQYRPRKGSILGLLL
jgi:hypothetical protein